VSILRAITLSFTPVVGREGTKEEAPVQEKFEKGHEGQWQEK
jgi:hypothetical protein